MEAVRTTFESRWEFSSSISVTEIRGAGPDIRPRFLWQEVSAREWRTLGHSRYVWGRRGPPSFEVGNVAARDTAPTPEVGVVVERDFGSMHHLDGRDPVVVPGRKFRVALARAHAEILARVIDVFVE